MRRAELWRPEGERIRCFVCPNLCLIAEGHTGICGVRLVEDGSLLATTWGRISSIASDPIEKKPVFHYHPGTPVLSIGSVGCSMRCGHCQNWQISRARPDDTAELHDAPPATVVEMARSYRCPGVAFTYNEPVIWIEYVADVARICREMGLFTVMVTNGYITLEALDHIGDLIDVWRVDLKGAYDETYRTLCRVDSVEPVMRAAERARHRWGMHVEVVTNIVPTVNDSAEELRDMAAFIVDGIGPETPWHLTRFFPYLDYADLPPTPIAKLREAREIGRSVGLHYVYLGNVDEPGGEDTVCPVCSSIAVERSGFTVVSRHTNAGACATCGTPLNIIE